MNKKQLALILIISAIIILSIAVVSAGLFDFNSENKNLKTHEFNYVDKVSFNISNELTNNTEVKNIIFGEGVSY